MSVALLIVRPLQNGRVEDQSRVVPVSGESSYWETWNPVIVKEGYTWLPYLAGGLIIDADNMAEVLTELRQLLNAVPRYYEPASVPYTHITERLTRLIGELEAVNLDELSRGEIELSVG